MTTAHVRPEAPQAGRDQQVPPAGPTPRGSGRTLLAGVLLLVGGVLNIVYGIAAASNSSFFTQNANYVFADLKTWGWITLGLGVLELIAAFSLWVGGFFGFWVAITVGCLAAIDALFSIPAYPFWSLAVFALSIWIVHGLIVYAGNDYY